MAEYRGQKTGLFEEFPKTTNNILPGLDLGFLLLGFVYIASQTIPSRWFSAAKKPAAKSATAGATTEEEADSAAAALLAERKARSGAVTQGKVSGASGPTAVQANRAVRRSSAAYMRRKNKLNKT